MNHDLTDFERLHTEVLLHWNSLYLLALQAKEEVQSMGPGILSSEKLSNIIERIGKEGFNANSCAYCKKFNLPEDYLNFCRGCPIKEKTGYYGCLNTPYNDAHEALVYLTSDYQAVANKEELLELVGGAFSSVQEEHAFILDVVIPILAPILASQGLENTEEQ